MVVATHEPGGTDLGTSIRELVLARTELDIAPSAEALLMNASLAQLVGAVIQPALGRGEIVVCDRFADSTLAYQGAGRGLDKQALISVISFATAGVQPDMTMLLDVPVEVGLARKHAQQQRDRFEAETLAFHARVQAAYLAMARDNPERWHCFDGTRPAAEIEEEVWRAVAVKMGRQP
jgi:dTMP kinase